MLYHMKLQPEPYNLVKSGCKTIELRLYDEKRKVLQVGDVIEFLNLKNKVEKLRVKVTALHKFDTFEELYKDISLKKCGYREAELDNASFQDMDIYYPREKQKKYGVLGIEFELMQWKSEDLIKISRFISLILRHKPEVAGVVLDKNGWADVDELILGVSKTHILDMALLEDIVASDDKQRYSFNEDKTKIRANQGHSIEVDVELQESVPPQFLWHGTGEKYVEKIRVEGIKPKTRLYVHLSPDYEVAADVGCRHGQLHVFKISAGKMHEDGFKFYKSVNNVWLTKYVPTEYFE